MLRHHTKDKGDRGLAHVVANLIDNGIQVALPISEHMPFDCIAILGNSLKRISVKYRKATRGKFEVRLRSTWADKNGSHVKKHAKSDYNAIAIYCPESGRCF